MPQFIDAGVGLGTAGKNRNTNANARKAIANEFTKYPQTPRWNFEAGNGPPWIRLWRTEAMQVMYEVNRPVAEIVRIWIKNGQYIFEQERCFMGSGCSRRTMLKATVDYSLSVCSRTSKLVLSI